MGHCVVLLLRSVCRWSNFDSIALQGEQDQEREGILTVAVDPKKRAVTQAQKAASAGYMKKINRSAYILQRWCEYERLRRED